MFLIFTSPANACDLTMWVSVSASASLSIAKVLSCTLVSKQSMVSILLILFYFLVDAMLLAKKYPKSLQKYYFFYKYPNNNKKIFFILAKCTFLLRNLRISKISCTFAQ